MVFAAQPAAAQLACPEGTAAWRSEPPAAPEAWCETPEGVREGPAETYRADGGLEWSGVYHAGRKHGLWVRYGADGGIAGRDRYWHGTTGLEVDDPDGVCPAGSSRVRIGRVNGRLQDQCLALDAAGLPIREGPTFTFSESRPGSREPLWLWDAIEYRAGERHGLHRRWHRAGVLELEERYEDGQLHGEATTWYQNGAVQERRSYRRGRLHGPRLYFTPEGELRWQALYDERRLVEARGDLAVADQPCPEGALPVTAADGLSSWCERLRYGSQGERHGAYAVWSASGEVVERGLYEEGRKVELWEVPPGEADPEAGRLTVRGEVVFAGLRLSELSRVEPSFWFRDEEEGSVTRPKTVYDDGRFEVFGLPPGYYFMGLGVDADPSNPPSFPGDLKAHTRFYVEAGEVTEHDAHLQQVMRLTAPEDNAEVMAGWDLPCAEKHSFEPPLRFAWAPIEGLEGVEYCYHVRRVACSPFRVLDVAAEGKGRETEVVLELPPSAEGESYYFEVHAFYGGRQIGGLMTHGEGGHGWDYRFRVHWPSAVPAAAADTMEP